MTSPLHPYRPQGRVLTTSNQSGRRHLIGPLKAASEYFGLGLAAGRAIIEEVALVTVTWRDAAKETGKETGARPAEIARIAGLPRMSDLSDLQVPIKDAAHYLI